MSDKTVTTQDVLQFLADREATPVDATVALSMTISMLVINEGVPKENFLHGMSATYDGVKQIMERGETCH